jgi:hypothetical protein
MQPQVAPSVQYSLKGQETVLGISAVVIEYRHDSSVRTLWHAPVLNCDVIKMTEELLSGSEVTDRFERSPVSIELGEPPAHVFAVPANYVERSPKQKFDSQLGSRPGRASAALERQDKRYYDQLRKAREKGEPLPSDLIQMLERDPY